MGVFLSCGFNSTLTSLLAIRGNTVSFKNLEDVAAKRTHSLCVRSVGGAYVHLTEHLKPGSPLQEKWIDLVNRPDCPNMNDSKNLGPKLCRAGVVYLEAPDIFLSAYRQVQHHCRIVRIDNELWLIKIAFLFARSFPYRRHIDA